MKPEKIYSLLIDLIIHQYNAQRHNTTMYSGFCIAVVVAGYYTDKILRHSEFLWIAGILISVFWFLSTKRFQGHALLRIRQLREIEEDPSFSNDNWKIFGVSYDKHKKECLSGLLRSVPYSTGEFVLPIVMLFVFVYLWLFW